jgi:translation initiation factor 1
MNIKNKSVLAYSTDGSHNKEQQRANNKNGDKIATSGPCKMRLEKNGRGGKQVTVLFNLPFSESEAKALLKTLQSQLGTGGTFKEGMIEFRGDVRQRVEEHFKQKNIPIVRAGG